MNAAHALLAELVAAAAEADAALAARLRALLGSACSPDEILILADAARAAGTSTRALRAAIRRGELVASRTGRHLAVRRSDLESWIGSRRVSPAVPAAPHSDIRERARRDHAAGRGGR